MKTLVVRRAAACCLAGGALAIGLSACGSASSSSTTTAVAAANPGGGGSGVYEARLNLAKCFRAHGVNVPDPSPNGGIPGGEGGGLGRLLRSIPQNQLQAAEQACQSYMKQAFPFLNLSPAQQAAFRQQFVKWAECMRSHGINIPDPSTNTAGGFGLRRALGSIDRNSPAFQSAQSACASLRPARPGAPGGPGGGQGG
jgi:hypothetical protein